jgi:hypothetical protein
MQGPPPAEPEPPLAALELVEALEAAPGAD